MKKNSFDKVIDKNLNKYINLPLEEHEYLQEFYNNPTVKMQDYYKWRSASMLCFGIHYYSFWYNPNEEDFKGIIDAFAMTYIAHIMYLYDKEKKYMRTLVEGVPLFLSILSFGKEREINLMFHAIIGLIRDALNKKCSINHQDRTLQEAFLLYDAYTNAANHEIWKEYITKPLIQDYQRGFDIILSDNEDEINSVLSDMMKHHRKTAHIESFISNEFYSTEWRVFPIEIIALMRYRYLQGKSIDFIEHEVLSKFIPYLKKTEYTSSPKIEAAKTKIYEILSLS